MMEHPNSDTNQHQQWFWQQLSPRHLDHRVKIPTAITLHRLVPKAPQASATTNKPAVGSFRHLKPEEIEQAQNRARHELLVARLSKDSSPAPPSSSHRDVKASVASEATEWTGADAFPLDQRQEKLSKTRDSKSVKYGNLHQHQVKMSKSKDSKSIKYGETSEHSRARPTLPVYRGMGESSLRTRQVSRLVVQISSIITELENMQKQTSNKKDFVTPLDNEVQRKRWEDFLRSAGRSLFSLKREVTLLERRSSQEQKNRSKYLRMLAVSTRTLHQLLLALKVHAEHAFVSAPGRELFTELMVVTQRVFSLVSSLGIKPPRLSTQVPKEVVENKPEDSSSDSLVLVTSDIESDVLSVLQPNNVRDKIARLARQRFKMKRRKKKSPGKDKGRNVQVKEQPGLPAQVEGRNTHGYGIHQTKRKPRGVLVSEERMSSPRRKGSPEKISPPSQSSSSVQRNSSAERSIRNPQSDSQYMMMDGHQLVEDTAEAVVNRLQSFFGRDGKDREEAEKKEEKTDATVQEEQRQPEATSITAMTQQIHFLLERACKIEDQQKKAQDLVLEVSQRMESKNNQDFSLETTIQKAKQVMSSLRDNGPHIFLPDTKQGSSKGITFSKDSDNPQKVQYSVPNHINRHTDDFATSTTEEESEQGIQKQKNVGYSEDHWRNFESIADQVKYQKEEFWASLVHRGFVKPNEVTDGAQDAHQVVEMMLRQSPLQDDDIGKNINGEHNHEGKSTDVRQGNARVKRPSVSTNVRRQRTLTAAQRGDKETQVGSSLVSSHSVSFPNESPESQCSSESSVDQRNTNEKSDSGTSSHLDASEGNGSVSSNYVNKDVESNLSVDNSSGLSKSDGSMSFPSYNGMTSFS